MASKYKNKKIEVDGIVYDSQKEMQRHQQLLLKEKAGAIRDLQTQVKYVLIPAQYETFPRYGKKGQRLKDGKRLLEKEIAYIADYVYFDVEEDRTIVEDVKSAITRKNPLYIVKRKMMLYFHNIRIREI
jgi:hypothetical protein